jgi:anti-sigma factor RsiW
MTDPQDGADPLEIISRYVDGDLFEEERREFEAALAEDPSLREELRATEAVKAVVSRVKYHNAPPELVIRVREELERAETRFRRPARFVWGVRWLRPALGLAAAMVVIFVFNLGDSPQRVALAEEVTDQCCAGHWRCCKPENRKRHKQTSNPKELEPYLKTELKGVEITLPDLSQRGLTLIEGHVCSVLEMPAAHVYYEAPGVCLSYYVIHGDIEEGVLGKRIPGLLDAYTLPEEYWKGRTDENLRGILWWCSQGCLCLVIADLTESELMELVRQCFPVRKASE